MSTPLETHNTNASRLTFSELLKECESGPFTAHKGQDDDDAHLVDQHGATVALFIPCGDDDRSAFIHAQTCVRLLNFAHAGGFSAIKDAAYVSGNAGMTHTHKTLIELLAILNGQTS